MLHTHTHIYIYTADQHVMHKMDLPGGNDSELIHNQQVTFVPKKYTILVQNPQLNIVY